ncbi:hypothetical protein [Longimicrobium sp.]|uniref:hypothetical protein n=1 Tax=Longimicrobium sp. TaxID=2029185 RepID=UPI003B3B1105
MSVRDLPWVWIAGAVLVAALVVVLMTRRPARKRHRSPRYEGDHGSGHGDGSGPPPTGEQRALLNAANQLRDALEKQARQMEELRTFWSQKLDELNGKIGELARAQARRLERAPDPPPRVEADGGYAAPYDAGMYGSESLGMQFPAPEPAWSPGPGPGDQPVEIRDGVLVVSRSLPPAGYVSVGGSGQARVYLNAEVPLTEFSLPKWAAFFDLQGARPYTAYRTRRPAEVRWDEGSGRGELISKGTAEAI